MRVAEVLRKLAAVTLAAFALSGQARAQGQDAVIVGRVTTEAGTPLAGVTVAITELGVGSASADDGRYAITVPAARVRGQTVRLQARRIGFVPATREVTLAEGSQTVDIGMKQDVARLEDVIVTGTAEATSAKKLTITVSAVTEEQINKVPATSPILALAGKVPGARIAVTNGAPGQAPAIRLRSSTNLTAGGNSPLIVVDGVITKNSLADINPNDIERIEVLKGAASANTYGSDAANGVISITTKRGRNLPEDKLTVTTRNEYGVSQLGKIIPLSQHHHYRLNADASDFLYSSSGQRLEEADKIADNPYPSRFPYRNQIDTWMEDGQFWTTYLSLGLRRGNTNFTTSYAQDKDAGILPFLNGLTRQNFRLNVDQGITDKADFSASFMYGTSVNDQQPNVTGTGTFFALLQAPPEIDLEHPFGGDTAAFRRNLPIFTGTSDRGNPLYDLVNRQYKDNRDRLIGSLQGRYRPMSWLSLDASFNTDRLDRRQRNYAPRGFMTLTGNPGPGDLDLWTRANRASNTQVNATAKNTLGDLRSTLRLTYLGEEESQYVQEIYGGKFNVGNTLDADALDPTQLDVESTDQTIRAQNYYATSQLDFKDRYLAQFMVRRDGSSLFGSAARWKTFYGMSGKYRISEDFPMPGIQELSIRAARGTAGVRPGFDDQYEVLNVEGGTFTADQKGNPNLRPAVQREDEIGLTAAFLDRFDFDLVWAQRKTEGAFLEIPISSAKNAGFTSQVQNAATISGRTVEGSINARIFQSADWEYSATLTGDRTRQRIDKLGRSSFRPNVTTAQGQNIFFYKEGEQLGVIYGNRFAKSLEDIRLSGFDPNLYTINDQGFAVLKTQLGTATEVPVIMSVKGNNLFKIADVNPDYSLGLSQTLRFKGLTLYGLLDGVFGGDVYNFSKQWMFQDLRHGEFDQSSRSAVQKKPVTYYSVGFYNALNPADYFVENGTYVKLREVSLGYDIGTRALEVLRIGGSVQRAKLALVGRNLATWTKYSGFDPEAAAAGDLNFRIDGFRYPSFRQITGQIEITF